MQKTDSLQYSLRSTVRDANRQSWTSIALQLEGHILNLTSGLDVEWGDLLVADFQQAVTGVAPQWFDESFLACASVEEQNRSLSFIFRRTGGKIFDELLHITGTTIISEDELFITYSTTTST